MEEMEQVSDLVTVLPPINAQPPDDPRGILSPNTVLWLKTTQRLLVLCMFLIAMIFDEL